MILNAVSIPVGNTNVSIKNTDDSSDVIELLHHFIRLLVVRLENILFDAWSHLKFRLCLYLYFMYYKSLLCWIKKILKTYFLWLREFTFVQKIRKSWRKDENSRITSTWQGLFQQNTSQQYDNDSEAPLKTYPRDNPAQPVAHLVLHFNITTQSRWTSLKRSWQHIFAVINAHYPKLQRTL